MTAFNKGISVVILSLLFLSSGCSKGFDADSLLDDAIEYTGAYPNPEIIVFNDHGSDKSVMAYPGQVTVFFKSGTSPSNAMDIIAESGSKIIAQLPSIGYYLLEVNVSQTNSTINKLNSNAAVEMAFPHVVGYLRGNVNIMDFCGDVHGRDVLYTLKKCGGSFSECKNLALPNTDCTRCTSPAKVIKGILDLAKKSNGGPTLINLSANGGLDNEVDWSKQSDSVKLIGLQGWYWFMFEALMTVRALPDEVRANLIITISAGNEKMPIDDVLGWLRLRDGFSEILSKNVLIVSTQKNNGFGNYAVSDPDVIVLNNEEASLGTSLAAPCAMGYLDSLINQKGVSASEALSTMKIASWLNRQTREVKMGDLLLMVGSEKFGVGLSNLTGSIIEHGNASQGDCVIKFVFEFEYLEIVWNGTSGIMRMPVTATASKLSGNCIASGVSHGYVSGPLTGNDLKFEGILSGTMTHSKGSWPLNLKFVGNKNSSSAITGVLTWPDAASEGFNGSSNLTLLKK